MRSEVSLVFEAEEITFTHNLKLESGSFPLHVTALFFSPSYIVIARVFDAETDAQLSMSQGIIAERYEELQDAARKYMETE